MRHLAAVCAILLLAACGRPAGDGTSSGRTIIQNKGSDTLVNVAQAWAENYKEIAPDVAVAVTGGGSGTGISAMINGTVDIASSSRAMKDSEIEQARSRGVEPVQHIVGYDALAVYLHGDNPIDTLSLEQLAEIYGEGATVESWSQLGVEVPGCDSDEIVVVSRQNNSGTYVYFKDTVLGKARDFRLGTRDLHGSKDVVDLVEKTPCAIGYSGLAYATHGVKLVCIETAPAAGETVGGDADGGDAADGEGGDSEPAAAGCVSPSVETAVDRSYPIARPLFMYTPGEPEGAVKAYLDWILSPAGQCIIADKGYAPAVEVDCS